MSIDCVNGRIHDDHGYDRGVCAVCQGTGCNAAVFTTEDLPPGELQGLTEWKRTNIQAGDIVLVEAPEGTRQDRMRQAARHFEAVGRQMGVRFALIPFGWTPKILSPSGGR